MAQAQWSAGLGLAGVALGGAGLLGRAPGAVRLAGRRRCCSIWLWAIGSLAEHAERVAADLAAGDSSAARQHVGWIVSRDTSELDESGVAKACVESTLENGNDAVFGALFWFILFGGAAAVLFRLANTLDAMWGYKTGRFCVLAGRRRVSTMCSTTCRRG